VGTPEDYLNAALALAGAEDPIAPGASVAPTARLTRTVVWPGATIGARVTLDDCIVLGVAVPEGFTASRAILAAPDFLRDGDQATTVRGVACFEIEPGG
jgi:hypothetical protein